eukprot:2501084-Rhodomonas_salina.3
MLTRAMRERQCRGAERGRAGWGRRRQQRRRTRTAGCIRATLASGTRSDVVGVQRGGMLWSLPTREKSMHDKRGPVSGVRACERVFVACATSPLLRLPAQTLDFSN